MLPNIFVSIAVVVIVLSLYFNRKAIGTKVLNSSVYFVYLVSLTIYSNVIVRISFGDIDFFPLTLHNIRLTIKDTISGNEVGVSCASIKILFDVFGIWAYLMDTAGFCTVSYSPGRYVFPKLVFVDIDCLVVYSTISRMANFLVPRPLSAVARKTSHKSPNDKHTSVLWSFSSYLARASRMAFVVAIGFIGRHLQVGLKSLSISVLLPGDEVVVQACIKYIQLVFFESKKDDGGLAVFAGLMLRDYRIELQHRQHLACSFVGKSFRLDGSLSIPSLRVQMLLKVLGDADLVVDNKVLSEFYQSYIIAEEESVELKSALRLSTTGKLRQVSIFIPHMTITLVKYDCIIYAPDKLCGCSSRFNSLLPSRCRQWWCHYGEPSALKQPWLSQAPLISAADSDHSRGSSRCPDRRGTSSGRRIRSCYEAGVKGRTASLVACSLYRSSSYVLSHPLSDRRTSTTAMRLRSPAVCSSVTNVPPIRSIDVGEGGHSEECMKVVENSNLFLTIRLCDAFFGQRIHDPSVDNITIDADCRLGSEWLSLSTQRQVRAEDMSPDPTKELMVSSRRIELLLGRDDRGDGGDYLNRRSCEQERWLSVGVAPYVLRSKADGCMEVTAHEGADDVPTWPSTYIEGVVLNKFLRIGRSAAGFIDDERLSGSINNIVMTCLSRQAVQMLVELHDFTGNLPLSRFTHLKRSAASLCVQSLELGTCISISTKSMNGSHPSDTYTAEVLKRSSVPRDSRTGHGGERPKSLVSMCCSEIHMFRESNTRNSSTNIVGTNIISKAGVQSQYRARASKFSIESWMQADRLEEEYCLHQTTAVDLQRGRNGYFGTTWTHTNFYISAELYGNGSMMFKSAHSSRFIIENVSHSEPTTIPQSHITTSSLPLRVPCFATDRFEITWLGTDMTYNLGQTYWFCSTAGFLKALSTFRVMRGVVDEVVDMMSYLRLLRKAEAELGLNPYILSVVDSARASADITSTPLDVGQFGQLTALAVKELQFLQSEKRRAARKNRMNVYIPNFNVAVFLQVPVTVSSIQSQNTGLAGSNLYNSCLTGARLCDTSIFVRIASFVYERDEVESKYRFRQFDALLKGYDEKSFLHAELVEYSRRGGAATRQPMQSQTQLAISVVTACNESFPSVSMPPSSDTSIRKEEYSSFSTSTTICDTKDLTSYSFSLICIGLSPYDNVGAVIEPVFAQIDAFKLAYAFAQRAQQHGGESSESQDSLSSPRTESLVNSDSGLPDDRTSESSSIVAKTTVKVDFIRFLVDGVQMGKLLPSFLKVNFSDMFLAIGHPKTSCSTDAIVHFDAPQGISRDDRCLTTAGLELRIEKPCETRRRYHYDGRDLGYKNVNGGVLAMSVECLTVSFLREKNSFIDLKQLRVEGPLYLAVASHPSIDIWNVDVPLFDHTSFIIDDGNYCIDDESRVRAASVRPPSVGRGAGSCGFEFIVSIQRSAAPAKVYLDSMISISHANIRHGFCSPDYFGVLGGSIAICLPPVGPTSAPPLPWWDSLAYWVHGRIAWHMNKLSCLSVMSESYQQKNFFCVYCDDVKLKSSSGSLFSVSSNRIRVELLSSSSNSTIQKQRHQKFQCSFPYSCVCRGELCDNENGCNYEMALRSIGSFPGFELSILLSSAAHSNPVAYLRSHHDVYCRPAVRGGGGFRVPVVNDKFAYFRTRKGSLRSHVDLHLLGSQDSPATVFAALDILVDIFSSSSVGSDDDRSGGIMNSNNDGPKSAWRLTDGSGPYFSPNPNAEDAKQLVTDLETSFVEYTLSNILEPSHRCPSISVVPRIYADDDNGTVHVSNHRQYRPPPVLSIGDSIKELEGNVLVGRFILCSWSKLGDGVVASMHEASMSVCMEHPIRGFIDADVERIVDSPSPHPLAGVAAAASSPSSGPQCGINNWGTKKSPSPSIPGKMINETETSSSSAPLCVSKLVAKVQNAEIYARDWSCNRSAGLTVGEQDRDRVSPNIPPADDANTPNANIGASIEATIFPQCGSEVIELFSAVYKLAFASNVKVSLVNGSNSNIYHPSCEAGYSGTRNGIETSGSDIGSSQQQNLAVESDQPMTQILSSRNPGCRSAFAAVQDSGGITWLKRVQKKKKFADLHAYLLPFSLRECTVCSASDQTYTGDCDGYQERLRPGTPLGASASTRCHADVANIVKRSRQDTSFPTVEAADVPHQVWELVVVEMRLLWTTELRDKIFAYVLQCFHCFDPSKNDANGRKGIGPSAKEQNRKGRVGGAVTVSGSHLLLYDDGEGYNVRGAIRAADKTQDATIQSLSQFIGSKDTVRTNRFGVMSSSKMEASSRRKKIHVNGSEIMSASGSPANNESNRSRTCLAVGEGQMNATDQFLASGRRDKKKKKSNMVVRFADQEPQKACVRDNNQGCREAKDNDSDCRNHELETAVKAADVELPKTSTMEISDDVYSVYSEMLLSHSSMLRETETAVLTDSHNQDSPALAPTMNTSRSSTQESSMIAKLVPLEKESFKDKVVLKRGPVAPLPVRMKKRVATAPATTVAAASSPNNNSSNSSGSRKYFSLDLFDPQLNFLDTKTHSCVVMTTGRATVEGSKGAVAVAVPVAHGVMQKSKSSNRGLIARKQFDCKRKNEIVLRMQKVSAFTCSTQGASDQDEEVVHWKRSDDQKNHDHDPTAAQMKLRTDCRSVGTTDGALTLSPLQVAVRDFQVLAKYSFWMDIPVEELPHMEIVKAENDLVYKFFLDLPEMCMDITSAQFYILVNVARNVLFAPPPASAKDLDIAVRSHFRPSDESSPNLTKLDLSAASERSPTSPNWNSSKTTNNNNNNVVEIPRQTDPNRQHSTGPLNLKQRHCREEIKGIIEAFCTRYGLVKQDMARVVELLVGKGTWILRTTTIATPSLSSSMSLPTAPPSSSSSISSSSSMHTGSRTAALAQHKGDTKGSSSSGTTDRHYAFPMVRRTMGVSTVSTAQDGGIGIGTSTGSNVGSDDNGEKTLLLETGFIGVSTMVTYHEDRSLTAMFELQRFWGKDVATEKFQSALPIHGLSPPLSATDDRTTLKNPQARVDRQFHFPKKDATKDTRDGGKKTEKTGTVPDKSWFMVPVCRISEPCGRCGHHFDADSNHIGACRFHADIYMVPGSFQKVDSYSKSTSAYTDSTDFIGADDSTTTHSISVGMWTCCGSTDFYDPGCNARPHSSKEKMVVIRAEVAPTVRIENIEMTVIQQLDINIFPGAADAYLQVHITRQLADMLHSYFIVEQDRDLQADYVAISDVPDSNSAAAAPKSSSAGGIGSSGSYASGNQTNGDGFGIATTKFASGQGSGSGSWRLGAIGGNLSRWLPSATRGLNLPRFMPRTAFMGNEQLDFVDRSQHSLENKPLRIGSSDVNPPSSAMSISTVIPHRPPKREDHIRAIATTATSNYAANLDVASPRGDNVITSSSNNTNGEKHQRQHQAVSHTSASTSGTPSTTVQVATHSQEGLFIRYLRIGKINVDVSLSGFPLNVENYHAIVEDFFCRGEVLSWQRLMRDFERHASGSVLYNTASNSLTRMSRFFKGSSEGANSSTGSKVAATMPRPSESNSRRNGGPIPGFRSITSFVHIRREDDDNCDGGGADYAYGASIEENDFNQLMGIASKRITSGKQQK